MARKVIAAESVKILALDPSTEITGAVFVEYSLTGEPRLIDSIAIDARSSCKGSDLSARLVRIRWTREQMYEWLGRQEESIDLIAYETDTNRGHAPSEALKMAAGAYLCLPHMALQPLQGITRQAACIYAGCLKEYRAPKGRTTAEVAAKKALLKGAIVTAMDKVYPDAGLLHPSAWGGDEALKAEAVADALAIGGAAAKVWRECQEEIRLASLQSKLPTRQKKAVA